MDSFYVYLKKQLLTYVEAEHKKGVSLEVIENKLLKAGHDKNILDDVFTEIKKEAEGKKIVEKKDPVKKDIESNLKGSILSFFAKASDTKNEDDKLKKELKDVEKKSDEIIEKVIEEAEIIEEKTMLEGFTFFIYMVSLGLLIFFAAFYSNSEIINVFLGFLPTIINAFASFFLLFLAENVPLYVMIPLVISSIFYALGKFAGFGLFLGMEIEALASVNFVISFIFNILIVYVRFIKPKHMKKKVMKKDKKKINDKEIKEEIKTTDEKKNTYNTVTSNNAQVQQKSYENKFNLNNDDKTEKHMLTERREIEELKKEFNIR